MKLHIPVLAILVTACSAIGYGQSEVKDVSELYFLADAMTNAEKPAHRLKAHNAFREGFIHALESEQQIQLDSMKWIQYVEPSDKAFQLYTWQLDQGSQSFQYFAVLKTQQGDILELQDRRRLNSEFGIHDAMTWYGCLYYGIEPFEMTNGEMAYLVLGFSSNDEKTNIKVADVLTLSDGNPAFGAPVFMSSQEEGGEVKSRILIEYADAAAGRMQFDRDKGMLIYDHVILVNAGPEGALWVPDGSFHAYQLKKGEWHFVDKVFHETVVTPPGEGLKEEKGKDILGRKKN